MGWFENRVPLNLRIDHHFPIKWQFMGSGNVFKHTKQYEAGCKML